MSGLLVEAGIVAGALALSLALLIALYLARPLQRLTEVARRLGAGEMETRATGLGGGREITRLAAHDRPAVPRAPPPGRAPAGDGRRRDARAPRRAHRRVQLASRRCATASSPTRT